MARTKSDEEAIVLQAARARFRQCQELYAEAPGVARVVEASAVATLANGDHPLQAAIETALKVCGYVYNIRTDAWHKVAA